MGRTRSNRVLAVLLAVLIVSAGPVGMIGSAAAIPSPFNGVCEQGEGAVELPFLTVVSDDCWGADHNTTIEDRQSKNDLYQSALNAKATSEPLFTGLDNYLQDTEVQSEITAKNAYIKALNAGDSEASSTTDAKDANADYYSVKQENLLAAWNASVAHGEHLENVTDNESGISDDFHNASWDSGTCSGGCTSSASDVEIDSFSTTEVTLVNGSTRTARTVVLKGTADSYTQTWEIGPTTGTVDTLFDDIASSVGMYGLQIGPTDSGEGPTEYLTFDDYSSRWSEIESQEQHVDGEIEMLVNNTFSEYQAGEINNSDLVDPYVLQQQASPSENFDSWALSTLSTMGVQGPENLSTTGSFEVHDNTTSTDYTGILMSQENPGSGSFEANSTYNASQIGGTQYVVTGSEIVELTGEFRVGKITDADGQNLNGSSIREVNYETANVSEMLDLYTELQKTRAELEAYQQRQSQFVGGGLFPGGSVPPGVAVGFVAALVLAVLLRS